MICIISTSLSLTLSTPSLHDFFFFAILSYVLVQFSRKSLPVQCFQPTSHKKKEILSLSTIISVPKRTLFSQCVLGGDPEGHFVPLSTSVAAEMDTSPPLYMVFVVTVKCLSHVWLFETPWTITCQAPLSVGFPKWECWSVVPFPSPGDLPNPGIEHDSPALQVGSLPSESPEQPLYGTGKDQFPRGKARGEMDLHFNWGVSIVRKKPKTKPSGTLTLKGWAIVKAACFW